MRNNHSRSIDCSIDRIIDAAFEKILRETLSNMTPEQVQRLSGNPAVSDSTAGAIAAAHWDEAFRRHEAAEKHEDLPGWEGTVSTCRKLSDLPANARRYLETLEELCGVPVEMVSTGPDRDSTIVDMGRGKGLLDTWFPVRTA